MCFRCRSKGISKKDANIPNGVEPFKGGDGVVREVCFRRRSKGISKKDATIPNGVEPFKGGDGVIREVLVMKGQKKLPEKPVNGRDMYSVKKMVFY